MQKTNASTVLLVFLAALFGLLGVYAFRKLARPTPVRQNTGPQKTTVPLASRNLEPGRVIALSDIALVRLTREQMKKRGISGMFMSAPNQIIGSTVMTAIPQGQTFHTQQLYADGFRPNVTAELLPGQRAVTVLLTTEDALGGYASAGQMVDIIFTLDPLFELPRGAGTSQVKPNALRQWNSRYGYHAQSGGPGGWQYTYQDRTANRDRANNSAANNAGTFEKTTETLMQGVKILALENNVVKSAQDVSDNEFVKITLAVSPEQAETLRVVEGQGRLSLTLRNPSDNSIVDPVSGRTLDQILGRKRIVAIQPQTPTKTEVFRGSSMTVQTFDASHPLAVRDRPEPPEVNPFTHEVSTEQTEPGATDYSTEY